MSEQRVRSWPQTETRYQYVDNENARRDGASETVWVYVGPHIKRTQRHRTMRNANEERSLVPYRDMESARRTTYNPVALQRIVRDSTVAFTRFINTVMDSTGVSYSSRPVQQQLGIQCQTMSDRILSELVRAMRVTQSRPTSLVGRIMLVNSALSTLQPGIQMVLSARAILADTGNSSAATIEMTSVTLEVASSLLRLREAIRDALLASIDEHGKRNVGQVLSALRCTTDVNSLASSTSLPAIVVTRAPEVDYDAEFRRVNEALLRSRAIENFDASGNAKKSESVNNSCDSSASWLHRRSETSRDDVSSGQRQWSANNMSPPNGARWNDSFTVVHHDVDLTSLECDKAIERIQYVGSELGSRRSRSISEEEILQCLNIIVKHCQVLGPAMVDISKYAREGQTRRFCTTIRTLCSSLCEILHTLIQVQLGHSEVLNSGRALRDRGCSIIYTSKRVCIEPTNAILHRAFSAYSHAISQAVIRLVSHLNSVFLDS